MKDKKRYRVILTSGQELVICSSNVVLGMGVEELGPVVVFGPMQFVRASLIAAIFEELTER